MHPCSKPGGSSLRRVHQVARVRRLGSLWRTAAGWNAVGSTLRVRFQAVGGEMQPWDYKEVFNGRSVVVVALTGACRSQVLCVCSRWCLCGRFRAAVARRELPRCASLLLPAWAWVCVALSGQGVLASASMCSSLLGSASVCSVCLILLRCGFVWQWGLRLCPLALCRPCQGVGVSLDLHRCARVGLRLLRSAWWACVG